MFSGSFASREPLTLICNSTISPTTASELLKTAVTLGESASAELAARIPPIVTIKNARPIFQSTSNIKHRTSNLRSPVVIDTTRCLVFIELNPSLFIFHRFKKRLGLTFAHLTFFFHFGFGHLGIFVRWFLWFVLASAFHFASKFFLRRFGWSSRWLTVFALSRGRRWRFVAALPLRCSGRR